MALFLLIVGLILFVALVVVHEFGHFIAARRNGVDVEEFGVGFPPRAKVLANKKGTTYSLNWLPLGGFVRLKGENDESKEVGSFGAASLKAKSKIMMAGVGMNLLTAFVLLTIGALMGLPKLLQNQFTIGRDTRIARQEVFIGYVEPKSPAEQAGIRVKDKLVSITHDSQTEKITNADDLPNLTKDLAGSSVQITVEREGREQYAFVTLRTHDEVESSKSTSDPKGYLGIAPTEFTLQRSTWSAPIVALGLMKQFTTETFKGLGSAISGLFQGDTAKATAQVSGPIGIFVLLRDGSLLGPEFVLFIIAIISLTLAIMNALPIPALDGGRLFVTLLFRVLHKPLHKSTEDKIHGVGFASLMLLFILVSVVDVKRFF